MSRARERRKRAERAAWLEEFRQTMQWAWTVGVPTTGTRREIYERIQRKVQMPPDVRAPEQQRAATVHREPLRLEPRRRGVHRSLLAMALLSLSGPLPRDRG